MYHNCLYVPPQPGARVEVLQTHHDDPLAGHFGVKRTAELIQRKYKWPQMARDIEDYVLSCTMCKRIKPTRQKPFGELQSLPIPE